LSPGIPKFGFTAGLPINLETIVGSEGLVVGLESFGESAPYKVLEEKFGFAVDPIVEKVQAFISK
jgi:transketolase